MYRYTAVHHVESYAARPTSGGSGYGASRLEYSSEAYYEQATKWRGGWGGAS